MKDKLKGLERIPAASKAEVVVDQLLHFFKTNNFVAGDRLPSEFELMEALGVGRSSVREAVRKLQAINVLEVRRGSGTFLRRIASANEVLVPLSLSSERESLLCALDIRRAIDCEAAELACKRATKKDVDRIRGALEKMEEVHLRTGEAIKEDFDFHLSIYQATGNPMFEQLMASIQGPFHKFFSQPFDRPDFGTKSFPLHRELFEAIEARNVQKSREKSLELLDYVRKDIEEMSST